MAAPLLIGGAPVVTLRADPPGGEMGVCEATLLPGRGFMLLQARLARPGGPPLDLLEAPDPTNAAGLLNGGPDDFAGNASFSFGGALLAPYANRIRGRPDPTVREIETSIDGRPARLPRNWGGKAPGAEAYAMHGLILAAPFTFEQAADDRVTGRLEAGNFHGRWPGQLRLDVEWALAAGGLSLRMTATNTGAATVPFGAGWHPWFRLPSGDRRQARLGIPAGLRSEVNDYDEVLPTGRLLEVAGTPYDFRQSRPLGGLYLDDCFTGLEAGEVEIMDPAAGLGLRLTSRVPPVRAVQVFAPPDRNVVVVEPQFNLADPFGAAWPTDTETGMVRLKPGQSATYAVTLSAFALAA